MEKYVETMEKNLRKKDSTEESSPVQTELLNEREKENEQIPSDIALKGDDDKLYAVEAMGKNTSAPTDKDK